MPELKWLFQLRTLPQAVLTIAACSAASGALAQSGSAINGDALFKKDVVIENTPFACRDCHDAPSLGQQLATQGLNEAGVANRISAAIAANRGGMSVYASLTAQERSDLAAYLLAAPSAPRPPLAPPPPPPTPTASPSPLLFNSTEIGSTSATALIVITNESSAPVSFHATRGLLTPVEGATTEFLPTIPPTGACALMGTLAPGVSCTIGAQFKPQISGARSAVWIVNFAGGVVTRSVTLEGTATGTAATPAPAPAPSPAPAPPPPSAANAPTSGGGGALGWESILALAALPAAMRRRRRAD